MAFLGCLNTNKKNKKRKKEWDFLTLKYTQQANKQGMFSTGL